MNDNHILALNLKYPGFDFKYYSTYDELMTYLSNDVLTTSSYIHNGVMRVRTVFLYNTDDFYVYAEELRIAFYIKYNHFNLGRYIAISTVADYLLNYCTEQGITLT